MALRLPRLQFSLRTLVILVIIVAVPACWHGSRYARYKARVTAVPELKALGIELRNDNQNEAREQLAAELTWAERYDAYWFGAQATEKYFEAYATGEEFHQALKQKLLARSGELLGNFPELQVLSFADMNLDEFARRPPINEILTLPPELMLGIARLPNLRSLALYAPAVIDEAWVAAFPADSPLQILHLEATELPPTLAARLLKKTPQLESLIIDQHSLDEQVVKLLNRLFAEEPGDNILRAKKFLHIRLTDDALEPCLAGLQVPFQFECQTPAWLDVPVLRLNLSRLPARRIICHGKIELLVQDSPHLEGMYFSSHLQRVPQAKVSKCPNLAWLEACEVDAIQLEQLPKLAHLKFVQCARIEVRDCAAVQRIEVTAPSPFRRNIEEPVQGKLTMADLPQLEALHCRMLDFESQKTPRLMAVTLEDATPGQIDCLVALPTVERLALRCNHFLPREVATALGRLNHIRFLIVDRCFANELEELFDPAADLLPPNLEALVCRHTSAELQKLQEQRPQLRIKALLDINPATQRPWIDQYESPPERYLQNDEFFTPAAPNASANLEH